MDDTDIWVAIAAIGAASYLMRAGGYLAAAAIHPESRWARVLKVASGNVLVAFVVAGCMQRGIPGCIGCAAALIAMLLTRREWLALGIGMAAALWAAWRGFG